MEEEKTIVQTKFERDGLLWLGTILILVRFLFFSDYERIGDVLTLIGAIAILGSCTWSRWNKRA
jgi:hypothetical protein